MCTDQSSSLAKFGTAMCKFVSPSVWLYKTLHWGHPQGVQALPVSAWKSLNEADFATVFKSTLDSSRNPGERVGNFIFGTYRMAKIYCHINQCDASVQYLRYCTPTNIARFQRNL